MSWNKLISLELDDDDKIDMALPCGPDLKPSQPDFPFGLRISLTEKELKKLGLDVKEADRGDELEIRALARVTCVSQNEGGDRVELQIERMAVESEGDD
jgi:hypothetical protein